MKKLLYPIIYIVLLQTAAAQQKPQYTQYVLNNYLLNPALSGIQNYIDVRAGYRSQWTGLDGAPVTSYFTINAPLGTNYDFGDATAMTPGGGVNPYSRSYTQDYQAPEAHHGIGMTIVTDKAGPITTTNIDATYAYHLGLAPRTSLAVGVAAGLQHTALDASEITLETPLDPAISYGNNSQWKPDLGLGMWLYSGNYFVGASVQQLLPQNLYFTTSTSAVEASKTVPHYFFTAGTKVFLSDDVTLMPSFLIKEINPVPVTYDLNLKLTFQDKFWLGGSYRHGDSYAVMTGLTLSSVLSVSYSYDITTSALNTVSNGTHEIVLGLILDSKYKVPQYGF